MPRSWLKYIEMILSRPVSLYLACFLGIALIINLPLFKKNATDQTMNRFGPEVNYYKDFLEEHVRYDPYKLRQCTSYYRNVVDFYPFEKPMGEAMLAFCYERAGDSNKAIKTYQDSADLNPSDFWPFYNLGVLYYKKGDYSKAADYFQKAIAQDVRVNLYVLYKSKIYTDVRLSDLDKHYDFFDGLRQGREDSYIFLMESLARMGNYKKLFETALLGLKECVGDIDVFYYYAGRSAFNQKSYDKALEFLKLALQANPQNADVLSYLGMCMQAAGHNEDAQKLFNSAKAIYNYKGSVIEKHLKTGVRFF